MGLIGRTSSLLVSALLLTQTVAQVALTNSNYNGITAGEPFNITFAGDGSPVTIYLKNGPSTNLQTVSTIISDTTTSPYTWTPSTTLTTGTYALEIIQGTVTNYSPNFTITGGIASTASPATLSLPTTTTAKGAIPPTHATGAISPTGHGPYATGAIVPSGYNATTRLSTGYASSTGVVSKPFEGAASRASILAQWVFCLMGAVAVVAW
ncbi:hypothetical protein MMC08_005635 [Hypocenomyce scalaris]|nr:hypothetical protein [Hypocenomyce scalaris]